MRLSSMTSIGVAWRKNVRNPSHLPQPDVGVPAVFGEPVHRRFQRVRRLGTVPVEQRRASDAGEQQLQVVDRRQAIGVLLLDRLALLGDAQVAVQGRRVNRLDEPMLGAASTAHGASAPVEETDAHARFPSDANERGLRAVQRPEAARMPPSLLLSL